MKHLYLFFPTLLINANVLIAFTFSGSLHQTKVPSLKKSLTSEISFINKSHFSKGTHLHLSNNEEETDVKVIPEIIKEDEIGLKKNNWFSSNAKTFKNLALSLFLVVCLTFAPFIQDSLAIDSGGRMGGSFSRQRSSSPSYSRSYSRPSVRSYSYSSPTIITPTPYYAPSPFFNPFGFGWGPRYGGGVVVSRGPSFFDVVVFAGLAFTLFSVFSKPSSTLDWPSTSTSALGSGFSVLQVSVALNVPKRDSPSSILSKLDYLAETAKTDSRVGLQNLVAEVSLELLRQRQSIVSASSYYSHYDDYNKAQRDYNKLSVRERSKFSRETVSKYKGVDYSDRSRGRTLPPSSQLPQATLAVVTLVLCIEGDSTKTPTIRSPSDLQNALSRISSDAVVDSCLQGAEILWTPQDRLETLSMGDVIADYPDLRTI